MKTTCLIALSLLAASVASADTTYVQDSTLAGVGWKKTATAVWGGTTEATVTESSNYGAMSYRFWTGTMPTSWEFDWAGVSTGNLAGTPLSAITSIKIRTFGQYGDNQFNWQPPSITLSLSRNGATSDRNLVWIPWTSNWLGASNPREPGVWHEYDCTTSGIWRSLDNNVTYSSFAAAVAGLYVGQTTVNLATTAQLPLDWGYASRDAVNIGNIPLYDEQRATCGGVAGYVDWVELGVSGVVTRYELVPEPSSLALLAVGFSFFALRRRK